ncbi:hypothetical protein, partial [Shigella boydii]|uniref:hypothetical protein n=3 Tax=Shigella boydii TaxID=621 RepID=UPI001C0A6A54
TFFCISDTLVPTTYLVDTTLSNSSDSDQTVQAARLRLLQHDFLTSHSIALSCLLRVFTSIYRLTDKLFINCNGMAEMRSETEG